MRKTNRERLTVAFTRMRVKGLIARQNFSCCGGCAASEIGEMLKARPDRIGGAYYHRQDAEHMRSRNGDGVWIGYGVRGDGDSRAIGILVCEALMEAGLGFEWPGDPHTRVFAHMPGGCEGEPEDEPHLRRAAERAVELIELREIGTAADAGYDAGEFSGPEHARAGEAELDALADLAGVEREILDGAIGEIYAEGGIYEPEAVPISAERRAELAHAVRASAVLPPDVLDEIERALTGDTPCCHCEAPDLHKGSYAGWPRS